MKKSIQCIIVLFLFGFNSHAQQLAFPTAEGYGKYTTGGRGGTVYEVTNLKATGPGSFGAAISASGPRTVVFRVSGTITGNFRINNGDITIAGQTAPGDGICIKGNLTISADNIIIRYIRVRFDPSTGESDAIFCRYNKDIILDHISASWSTDEVFSVYMNENVTIQWCMITEACAKFVDGENTGHRFGGIWGNNKCTMHHNLIAHNASRNPRWASGCGYNDYRNNVIYNWDYESSYGGEKSQTSSDFGFTTINMIANYYKSGPATDESVKRRIAKPSARSADDKGDWYVSDNYVDGYPDVTADNWLGVDGDNYIQLNAPWDAMAINQQTAEEAYLAVLDSAGCLLPGRDAVDERIINEVRTSTAAYGDKGMVTYGDDLQGWPVLNNTSAPADSDHDGMADDWETANGLNPDDASDRNNVGSDGYTMLENYINSLAVAEGCDPEPVTDINVSPATETIGVGLTTQLLATVAPLCAGNNDVSWSSSDPEVATVNASGVVTGVAEGTAVITVTTEDGGFTDQCTVTVAIVPFSINSGGPPSGYFLADQFYSGGSSYSNGATIDMSQITEDPPPAEIFNTERYGNFTYTVSNLIPGSAQIVVLYFSENYFSAAGQRVFNVSINGSTVLSNFDIYATAGGKNVAIAKSLTATANSSGEVAIQFTSVTDNAKISGVAVSLAPPIPATGVSVSPTTASVNVGSTTQLTATIEPSDVTNNNVSWSSSNTSIATVDPSGLVTGVAEGTASITVTTEDGGFSATSDVTVLKVITVLESMETSQDISIYPVPFNNYLNIQFKREPPKTDIFLLDATGRIVRHKKTAGLNNQFEIADLNAGFYIVRLVGTAINIVKPVIKMK